MRFRPNSIAAAPTVLGWRGLAGVACGLLVLIGVAVSAVVQAERNAHVLAQAEQTQALRAAITSILVSAQNAETGQRGYLLTQDRQYLAPFNRAKRELPRQLETVSQQLPNDPRMWLLQHALTAKMAELQQSVDMTAAGKPGDALASVRTGAGLDHMRKIRASVTALSVALDDQLRKRSNAIRRGGRSLIVIDVVALVLVVLLASLIAVALQAYLANLAAARQAASTAYAALKRQSDQLDDTVRARTAALTAANTEIQRFAYIVSHDLRAPLINIMGFTGELEQATATLAAQSAATSPPEPARLAAAEDIAEALRFIRASTDKMDKLIKAILKLSREGQRTLTPEPIDMGVLIAGLFDTMRHQAADVAVSIGSLPAVLADRAATEQVFGNVCDNAIKYLAPGRPGTISVSATIEGSMARFDVADNGRGIAERDHERVFELFRRAGDHTVPGEGIGLAHVRALVRRMGGTIGCRSQLGVGTTFMVWLPIMHDPAADIDV